LTFLFNNPLEKLVDLLSKKLAFKDRTNPKDIILVLKEVESNVTVADFAQVQEFSLDPTKRDEWWEVSLTFLSIPLANATYFLQTDHFTGKEIFTMGGKKVFIKALDTSAPDKGLKNGFKSEQESDESPPKPVFTLIRDGDDA
jgi:hypothetical protein